MSHYAETFTRAQLRTPKAAATAGIVFSILLSTALWVFGNSVPADPLEHGEWLATSAGPASIALHLIPFSGVAFLWFIGVLRDRLGSLEDRFFATVFIGSALLFLSSLFMASALIGAIILIGGALPPNKLVDTTAFMLVRAAAYVLMNVYAVKLAGVFMISTSTVIIYTKITPRWIAIVGYVLAGILLVGSHYISWSFMVLPVWVLVISVQILIDNFRPAARPQT